jgi:hypothetical protein
MKPIICENVDLSVDVTTLKNEKITLKPRTTFDLSGTCIKELRKKIKKASNALLLSYNQLTKGELSNFSDQEKDSLRSMDINTDADMFANFLSYVYDVEKEYLLDNLTVRAMEQIWAQVQEEIDASKKK